MTIEQIAAVTKLSVEEIISIVQNYTDTVQNGIEQEGIETVKGGSTTDSSENTSEKPTTDTNNTPSINLGNVAVVDFGLPSGNLWTTTNIGAENPWDYGDYYAWGETETKKEYSWENYKYGHSSSTLTKYCDDYLLGKGGFTDDFTVLEASDDVATVKLGKDYSIPINDDWKELFNSHYTKIIWTSDYNGTGVAGRIVYKKKANGGYTLDDVHIFLPAAGYRYGSSVNSVALIGSYWSSSLHMDISSAAYGRSFNLDDAVWYYDRRYLGRSVRAVRRR